MATNSKKIHSGVLTYDPNAQTLFFNGGEHPQFQRAEQLLGDRFARVVASVKENDAIKNIVEQINQLQETERDSFYALLYQRRIDNIPYASNGSENVNNALNVFEDALRRHTPPETKKRYERAYKRFNRYKAELAANQLTDVLTVKNDITAIPGFIEGNRSIVENKLSELETALRVSSLGAELPGSALPVQHVGTETAVRAFEQSAPKKPGMLTTAWTTTKDGLRYAWNDFKSDVKNLLGIHPQYPSYLEPRPAVAQPHPTTLGGRVKRVFTSIRNGAAFVNEGIKQERQRIRRIFGRRPIFPETTHPREPENPATGPGLMRDTHMPTGTPEEPTRVELASEIPTTVEPPPILERPVSHTTPSISSSHVPPREEGFLATFKRQFNGEAWHDAPVKTGFRTGGMLVSVGLIADAAARSTTRDDQGKLVERDGLSRLVEATVGVGGVAASTLIGRR